MILEPAYQKIEQQPAFLDPKPLSEYNAPQSVPDQPIQNVEPIKYLMDFVPPPINDSTKYHDQLQNDFLQTLSKNPVGVDYLTLFGEKRPLDISHTKLPEPLFVDASTKVKMKKMVRSVYQKMIETLKYCAGQLPMSQGSPLSKIQEKSHQLMQLCQQVQVAQTQQKIWKIMQEETEQMNEKADQIEEFLKGMAEHCNNQKGKQGYA